MIWIKWSAKAPAQGCLHRSAVANDPRSPATPSLIQVNACSAHRSDHASKLGRFRRGAPAWRPMRTRGHEIILAAAVLLLTGLAVVAVAFIAGTVRL